MALSQPTGLHLATTLLDNFVNILNLLLGVRTQLKTIAMSFKELETQEQTDIKSNTSHDTVT